MSKRSTLTYALVALILSGQVLSNAYAAEPAPIASPAQNAQAMQIVKSFYSHLLDVMKQGEQLGFSGRYKKLETEIRASFNLPLMTKFVVGTSWADASDSQRAQLTAAFSDFSIANYASRFSGYDGEQFEIVSQKPSSGGIIVETLLRPKDGDPVHLDYLVRPDEKGAYRIVDVFLNGTISELATRRSEFSSIAKREGIPALVSSITQKSRQLGAS